MTGTEAKSPDSSAAKLWLWLGTLTLCGLITVNLAVLIRQLNAQRQQSREHAYWTLCQPGAGPQERTRCLLQLVSEGNTRWEGALLDHITVSHVDFFQVSLRNAAFSDGEMKQANFREADLTGAAFSTCNLADADFEDATLRNATLFKSTLTNASFRNADLLSASLEQTKAPRVVFVAAKMADAFLPMADLSGANLTAADLTGADLSATILKDAELALANLADAKIEDADFTNTNWWRARGLTTKQLERLLKEFPPGPSAPESRRRDFAIWAETWQRKSAG